MRKLHLIFAFLIATTLMSCVDELTPVTGGNGNETTKFGIFNVQTDGTTVLMNGDITSRTLNDFNKLIAKFPNINKINMNNVPGSTDDEVNLQVSKKVHDLNIDIHLLDNAEIASGGVDFFVAGIKRTRGTNTRIGVHSWGGDNGESASDYPVGHEFHLPYINFYKSVGFTQDQSEMFYYFTINAAPASGIHWMTDAEVEQYGLLTQ